MGIFSSDKNTRQTTTQTTYNTSQGYEDVSGVIGDGNTVVYSDHDAISNASEIARSAVDAAENLAEINADAARVFVDASVRGQETALNFGDALTRSALVSNRDTTRDAFDFGSNAFGTVEMALGQVGDAYNAANAYQRNALELVADSNQDSQNRLAQVSEAASKSVVDTVKDFFADSLAFASNLSVRQQTQLGDTVSALNAIAVEQNKSTDQRVAEISANATKSVVVIVGVLAVAGALFAIFRKG